MPIRSQKLLPRMLPVQGASAIGALLPSIMSRRTHQRIWNWTVRAIAIAILTGCAQQQPFVDSGKPVQESDRDPLKQVSYEETVEGLPPGTAVVEPPPFALDTDLSTVAYWDYTITRRYEPGFQILL